MWKSLPLVPLFLASFAWPASIARMSFETLVQRSDAVVYGRVLGSRCFYDTATRTIWTETEISVIDSPKGRAYSTIRVTEPGGVIGDVAHWFPGIPKFGAHQEVVVFVYQSAGRRLRVTGLRQGVYSVATDPDTRVRFTRLPLDEPEVRETGRKPRFERNHIPPARQRLDEFLSAVRRRAAAR